MCLQIRQLIICRNKNNFKISEKNKNSMNYDDNKNIHSQKTQRICRVIFLNFYYMNILFHHIKL